MPITLPICQIPCLTNVLTGAHHALTAAVKSPKKNCILRVLSAVILVFSTLLLIPLVVLGSLYCSKTKVRLFSEKPRERTELEQLWHSLLLDTRVLSVLKDPNFRFMAFTVKERDEALFLFHQPFPPKNYFISNNSVTPIDIGDKTRDYFVDFFLNKVMDTSIVACAVATFDQELSKPYGLTLAEYSRTPLESWVAISTDEALITTAQETPFKKTVLKALAQLPKMTFS